jgi:anthranilate phosphoribosyltransferase
MNIQQALKAVTERQNLSREQMTSVMRQIMTGEASQAQIGGFLVSLRMKGETVEEITAAASVMRELASGVEVPKEHLVDTCGTGGDGSGLFNVSTAVAFVAAAAGATVAKHGNRSITSKSGSADLLEAAGVNLTISPEQVATCVQQLGVGFMFAPAHHGAMKHAIGPRKEMAVRTIFNVLGPLTNPAGAPNQVLGVFSQTLTQPLAEVLQALGSRHVLVVASDDGLDEISIAAATQVSELKDGEVTTWTLNPADYGISGSLDAIVVDSAEASLALIQQAFAGEAGPAADIIALNAGAAIYAAGVAESLVDGIAKAREVMANGAAAEKLAGLVSLTQELAA